MQRFKKISSYPAVFPLRKFYTEQIFILVSMQLRNHVETQPLKRFKRYKDCAIYMHKILNVANAQEWDFTAQMVCWYFAFERTSLSSVYGSKLR